MTRFETYLGRQRSTYLTYQVIRIILLDMSNNNSLALLDAYSALRREIGLMVSFELNQYKLGRNQMTIVIHLDKNETATLSEISEITMSDPASTTRTINSMEKAGWVKRMANPKDQRQSLVSLTAKGRKQTVMANELRQAIAVKVNQTLSKDEGVLVSKLMTKIVEGLQQSRALNDVEK